uniref:Uncharacterized protein n=1 Tax=Rhizophora mucronata TaxID=61149 RepID=A0A2P2R387_RHIMU
MQHTKKKYIYLLFFSLLLLLSYQLNDTKGHKKSIEIIKKNAAYCCIIPHV